MSDRFDKEAKRLMLQWEDEAGNCSPSDWQIADALRAAFAAGAEAAVRERMKVKVFDYDGIGYFAAAKEHNRTLRETKEEAEADIFAEVQRVLAAVTKEQP